MHHFSPALLGASLAFIAWTLPASAQSRSDPQTMMRLWSQANGQCRGGSGDDQRTLDACDEREAYSKRLRQLGWCYGMRNEYGYQHRWHRCTRGSL